MDRYLKEKDSHRSFLVSEISHRMQTTAPGQNDGLGQELEQLGSATAHRSGSNAPDRLQSKVVEAAQERVGKSPGERQP